MPGRGADGMTVLRLAGERVACAVLPLGAALHTLEVRQDGRWRNLVLSRPDPGDVDGSLFGATVGRVANRIGDARFGLDGVVHALARNDGRHHLHGGPDGFGCRRWEVLDHTPGSVALRLVSPDGDQGYPGRLEVTATFSLLPDGAQVVYTATTDAPTPVNLSIHPYLALGGPLAGHRVSVHAGRYTPTRADDIPTGEIAAVDGTPLDLRRGAALGPTLAALADTGLARAGGLNHNLLVDGEGLREQVRVTGPDGLTVVVCSDAPAVQLYSGEHLGRRGLAVEPQDCPDAVNHPAFGSVILRPGRTWTRTIQWLVEAPSW
ncbi:MAG: aldose epimerase family protein [Propionicimonas sp.]|uniref:aldose epimerase family protein n=1 Tax=Propionicimonas sp. TaxID=1955623 RepID=UPI002B203A5B|nr:aldose epimerase family protein [Propionicimonas sp.]MEA4944847.1 aldose epimerase family protein [Propionicimonas sp.]